MYQNPYTPGFEVLSKSGYSVDSQGSSASYLVTNDFPDYAAMFYSPTEHETMTSIKYGNFEQDYSNMREIQQSLNGPPIEFYIPHSANVPDGAGRQDAKQVDAEVVKNQLIDKMQIEAMKEIENAQNQITGKNTENSQTQFNVRNIKSIQIEELFVMRKRKRTIIFESKE